LGSDGSQSNQDQNQPANLQHLMTMVPGMRSDNIGSEAPQAGLIWQKRMRLDIGSSPQPADAKYKNVAD
jgi:hypothetical protein